MASNQWFEKDVKEILFRVRRAIALDGQDHGAESIDIASHLSRADRAIIYHLIRERLNIRDAPEVTRQVKDPPEHKRLLESLYASNSNESIAVVERREPPTRAKEGNYYDASIVIVQGSAFVQKTDLLGRPRTAPSPALTKWCDGAYWSNYSLEPPARNRAPLIERQLAEVGYRMLEEMGLGTPDPDDLADREYNGPKDQREYSRPKGWGPPTPEQKRVFAEPMLPPIWEGGWQEPPSETPAPSDASEPE